MLITVWFNCSQYLLPTWVTWTFLHLTIRAIKWRKRIKDNDFPFRLWIFFMQIVTIKRYYSVLMEEGRNYKSSSSWNLWVRVSWHFSQHGAALRTRREKTEFNGQCYSKSFVRFKVEFQFHKSDSDESEWENEDYIDLNGNDLALL